MDFFAHEREGKFWNIYPSAGQVRMCGDEPVVPIQVDIDENGEYVGWQDTGSDTVCMIYQHIILLRMCFPYGIKVEIESGKGKVVHLSIKRKENKS